MLRGVSQHHPEHAHRRLGEPPDEHQLTNSKQAASAGQGGILHALKAMFVRAVALHADVRRTSDKEFFY